jgi:hypothetical protein
LPGFLKVEATPFQTINVVLLKQLHQAIGSTRKNPLQILKGLRRWHALKLPRHAICNRARSRIQGVAPRVPSQKNVNHPIPIDRKVP